MYQPVFSIVLSGLKLSDSLSACGQLLGKEDHVIILQDPAVGHLGRNLYI